MKPREQRKAELDQKTHAELVTLVLALEGCMDTVSVGINSLLKSTNETNARLAQMIRRAAA